MKSYEIDAFRSLKIAQMELKQTGDLDAILKRYENELEYYKEKVASTELVIEVIKSAIEERES